MTNHITLAEYKARPARPRSPRVDYKAKFERDIALLGFPAPVREVLFAHPRRWRFDFAYPELMIAVEYQGGNYNGKGAHNSITGLQRDYEKFTEAALRGWTLILIDAKSVTTGQAVQWLERALETKGVL